MDADLENMSRDNLIVEVTRLRDAIRAHRDATATIFVGIIPICGRCSRKGSVRKLRFHGSHSS